MTDLIGVEFMFARVFQREIRRPCLPSRRPAALPQLARRRVISKASASVTCTISSGRLTVEGLRVEVLADAFDLVLVHVARIGVDGAFRVGADHLHLAVGNVLEVAAGAGDGATGADARHEMRDLMIGGLPDFRAGGVVVAQRAVRIVVLVGAVAAGNGLGEAVCHLVVGTWIVGARVGGGHDHFGAVCAQYGTLGFGDLVRQGEDGTVAALLGDHAPGLHRCCRRSVRRSRRRA